MELTPAAWRMDACTRFHGRLYPVGLPSAAAPHGAAQLQMQELPVITGRILRPSLAGRTQVPDMADRIPAGRGHRGTPMGLGGTISLQQATLEANA